MEGCEGEAGFLSFSGDGLPYGWELQQLRRSIARSRFLAVRSPGLERLGTLKVSCRLGRVAPPVAAVKVAQMSRPGHPTSCQPCRSLRRGPVSVCTGAQEEDVRSGGQVRFTMLSAP